MKNFNGLVFVFLCVATLFGGFASANLPNSSSQFIASCSRSKSCELQLFAELSKLYRPSKEESAVKDYILKLKTNAEISVWQQKISYATDQVGNVALYIPATGKFTKLPNVAPIALQSHMDMVLAYKFAKPGEDIRPYFKNGVVIEETAGWLHSKDNTTTLGADNAIGMALALKYLFNKKLEHPRLELIFTVQEEIGLLGVIQMKIPLRSPRMINLDGMAPEPQSFIVGSQGASTNMTLGAFKPVPEEGKETQYQIYMGNLAGGHSGNDIHKDRLNAIQAFARLMTDLYSQIPQIKLYSAVAGDPAAVNKIPNLLSVVISVPESDASPKLMAYIQDELTKQIMSHQDENRKDFQVQIKEVPADKKLKLGIDSAVTKEIVGAFLKTPNGVLQKSSEFPNSVLTSSNMGNWIMGVGGDNMMSFNLGFMPRSFDNGAIGLVADQIKNTLETAIKKFGSAQTKNMAKFPAWIVPNNSPLRLKALSLPQTFNKTFFLAAGLEPSAYLEKYPKLDVIAIAPFVQEAHTINERLNLQSVAGVSAGLDTLLSSLQ